jgi:hypothetical protein
VFGGGRLDGDFSDVLGFSWLLKCDFDLSRGNGKINLNGCIPLLNKYKKC